MGALLAHFGGQGEPRVTDHADQSRLRVGLDLGGSKIEGILLSPEATELARYRIATPREDYAATIAARTPQSASPSLVPSHPTLA